MSLYVSVPPCRPIQESVADGLGAFAHLWLSAWSMKSAMSSSGDLLAWRGQVLFSGTWDGAGVTGRSWWKVASAA